MLEWIKTFIVVYETRNFSLAAKKLFISQPTVSMQIKKLERQYNLKLFSRSGKQTIIPTKEADFLYPKCLDIIDILSSSFTEATIKDSFREELVIACSHTNAIYIAPKIIKKLIKQFPNLDFSVKMMNSTEVVQSLDNNTCHIGLIEKPMETPNLVKDIFLEDKLVLAGDSDAKFWILREQESGLRFYNEIYLHENNLSYPIIYVDNNEVLIQMISEGIGKSIISKLSVSPTISYSPIEEIVPFRKLFILKNNVISKSIISEVYGWLLTNRINLFE
ncbi:LysR family transcriptional regulator [Enterococcus sp. AN402]|uniref:LysR family transcriptional regulator n=1 Tax=Enterococcus sp. AN402 TaxID=3151386 RepID=UPI00345AEA41